MPKPTRNTRIPWATLVATALTALLAVLLPPPGPAHAASGPGRAGESRPVHSYDRAVRESVWVEVRTSARRTDRVAVDIVRPREPAQQGRRVPVIMDASPYYACCGRGNESQKKTYDEHGDPVQFPLYYDNYFVPRGYAVVLVDLAGTNRSDGCVDVGGRSDVQSAKAVVDWLNGRARGYRSRTGDTPVTAGWSTGAVGMIGKSYDGTVANAVAATGVDGLRTIVPIGAISSWYDYYFAKGAALFGSGPDGLASRVESDGARARCAAVQRRLVEGAPRNGDWTPLWSERDYVRDAGRVKASVFAVHGLQDLNVRTKHLGQWWDALAAHGVERKIWLSTAGHVDPFDFRREAWVPTLHRWFDHYLMGYDNGVEREPMADVERAPDQWTTDRVWPPAGTRTTTLRPAAGPVAGVGTLGLGQAAPGTTARFTDDPRRSEADWSAAADRATPDKAGFVTRPLTRDLRLSGSSAVRLRVTPSTSSARLSAVLVDLGPAAVRDYAGDGEGIRTLPDRTCWGAGTAGDTGCFQRTEADVKRVDHTVFSRGWADLGHWASARHGRAVTPGRPYTITLDLAAADHVVPAGHRLALIVAGTDAGLIEPASTTPRLTVDLHATSAGLPLVGGYRAFVRATSGAAVAPSPAPEHPRGVRVPVPSLTRLP
ncbi:Xaa-Pro dipeptidyl-peptidase [Streptomyces caatingaensis]|uniref:X-prolyl-dipeptidyl aminopeptidase n=1 Tax=Streptomyces caatingaensis TaxID=1678637 RepID=A0A0K9XKM7_9ACTN|nr:Xaa-Pro dipeptidyl-peptidase [Streptomyces caatingaensis]KNB53651.1 x-prolyl-dipeptidyl aminopeptidase [Streptomyces caatingaensis]